MPKATVHHMWRVGEQVSGAMTKNMARRWTQSFATMRDDERGAEATKAILILVVAVLALIGAFCLYRALTVKETHLDVGVPNRH